MLYSGCELTREGGGYSHILDHSNSLGGATSSSFFSFYFRVSPLKEHISINRGVPSSVLRVRIDRGWGWLAD